MFKDATKGSTFHKSKKIIRPGDSIPEHVAPSPRRHTAEVKCGDDQGTSVELPIPVSKTAPLKADTPVSESISQLKSNMETVPTDYVKSPAIPLQQQHQPISVKNSPFLKKNNANSEVIVESQTRTSSPNDPPSNPYAVKLRKTKTTPIKTVSSSNQNETSPIKEEHDSSANANNDGIGEAPSNPFLANVKLRKTGTIQITASQSKVESVDQNTAREDPQPAEPKKKMSYKESRELLKKQQEAGGQHEVVEEPKKDVAALIKERIAMSKQNAEKSMSSPQTSVSQTPTFIDLRGNLKKASTPSYSNAESSSQSFERNAVVSISSSPTPSQMIEFITEHESHSESTKQNIEESTQVVREESNCVDPRAALMAMLNKRAQPQAKEPHPEPKPEPEPEPEVGPKANLAAMLQKRSKQFGAPVSEPEDDDNDAKAKLSAMLQSRMSPKAAEPQSIGGDAKNALSAILANRAPPSEDSKPAEQSHNSSNGDRPALKDDPKYAKYIKMLKVGMPLPVVQHAMNRDGLDPAVLEGDHNKPVPEPKPEGIPLKEDPAFAKYFKMLKLGLPLGAVKNAMERDGLDSSVMDGDHNKPASSSTPAASKKREKDTHRRTRLHWDTLNKVKSNTVWALVEEDEELEGIEIDENEFTNLFQAEIKTSSAPAERSSSSARSVVQVIDPKRANNGGIILARLRMSYDDMAKAVEYIDETAMSANQAQGIIEYMPTSEERKSLRDYMKASNGDSAAKFEKLCECEKFMVAMMTVKQSNRKLRALLFKLQFRGCIHDLAHDVFSVEKACDELNNSVRLRKLFGIVLNIGNRLNTAGPGEKRKAGAFSIKSLLKLNQAKAFDNKTTFLHFVVKVVQRNNEYLLDFKDDLPTVSKADKIFWDQCVNELEEVETQLENVRKLALFEAKSNKVVYQLPKKKKSQEDNDSDDLSIESMSLEEEVAMLRSTKIGMFALSAIKKVSQLRDRVETAKNKFSRLLEYFGEDGENSKMQPHELFEIISTFCRNFDAARGDVDKMEKAKKRDEKKASNQDDASSTKGETNIQKRDIPPKPKLKTVPEYRPPPKKSPAMPRASSLQPNMSNVLADLKRATVARFQSTSNDDSESSSHQGSPAPPDPVQASPISPSRDEQFIEHHVNRTYSSPHQAEKVYPENNVDRLTHVPSATPRHDARHNQESDTARRDAREGDQHGTRCNIEQDLVSQNVNVPAAKPTPEQHSMAQSRPPTQIEPQRAAVQQSPPQSDHFPSTITQQQTVATQLHLSPQSLRATHGGPPKIVTETPYDCAGQDIPATPTTEKTPPRSSSTISARRERARNRRFIQTSPAPSPVASAQTSNDTPASKPQTPKVSPPETPSPAPKSSSTTGATSNTTARAAARDRYARHKKLLQQRHSST